MVPVVAVVAEQAPARARIVVLLQELAVRIAVAVQVGVLVPGQPFVHLHVAIVVLAVLDFLSVGMNRGVHVVAVAGFDGPAVGVGVGIADRDAGDERESQAQKYDIG